jgi:hypothetical protein
MMSQRVIEVVVGEDGNVAADDLGGESSSVFSWGVSARCWLYTGSS